MKLNEIDIYMGEIVDMEYDLFNEQDQEYRLWLDQRVIYISEYHITIREGIYEGWNMENQDYEFDHSFYMIFDENTGEYVYSEAGSSMSVSLYNFLVLNNCGGLSYNKILDLDCELKLS